MENQFPVALPEWKNLTAVQLLRYDGLMRVTDKNAPPEASEKIFDPGYGISRGTIFPSLSKDRPFRITKPPPLYGSPAMKDSASSQCRAVYDNPRFSDGMMRGRPPRFREHRPRHFGPVHKRLADITIHDEFP